MRAHCLIALFVAAALASPAPGLSIAPPRAWLQASPNGRFVYVWPNAGWSDPLNDPDAATIKERCKTAGLYRRGEWDAPVWELDLGDQNWKTCWVSNDGVHLVYQKRLDSWLGYGWVLQDERKRARQLLDARAFTFYARGREVRTALVREALRDPSAAMSKGGWLEKAEFGEDGRFSVATTDGNRTVFDPSTGNRVEGEGCPVTLGERFDGVREAVDDLLAGRGWRDLFLAASVAAVVGYAVVLSGQRLPKR